MRKFLYENLKSLKNIFSQFKLDCTNIFINIDNFNTVSAVEVA